MTTDEAIGDSLDHDFLLLTGLRPESRTRAEKHEFVSFTLDKIRIVRPCGNDRSAKRLEIEDAIDALAPPDDEREIVKRTRADLLVLYQRAVFFHWEDVAFARVMLIRGDTIDKVASDSSINNAPFNHRCDPVNPQETT
jgi:hypothetical protein